MYALTKHSNPTEGLHGAPSPCRLGPYSARCIFQMLPNFPKHFDQTSNLTSVGKKVSKLLWKAPFCQKHDFKMLWLLQKSHFSIWLKDYYLLPQTQNFLEVWGARCHRENFCTIVRLRVSWSFHTGVTKSASHQRDARFQAEIIFVIWHKSIFVIIKYYSSNFGNFWYWLSDKTYLD